MMIGSRSSFLCQQACPITVPIQAGEFEVIVSLLRYSIPYLTGWAQTMEVALQNSLSMDLSGASGGGNVPF